MFKNVKMVQVITILVAFVLGVASFMFVDYLVTPPPFNPWGQFPVQDVLPEGASDITINGVSEVFSLSDVEVIGVTATRCTVVEEPVEVGGTVHWFIVVPPAKQYTTNTREGGTELLPGCTTSTFRNVIPDEVRTDVEKLLKTEPYVIMNIHGYTVPYEDGEEAGVRKTWTTENFALVP